MACKPRLLEYPNDENDPNAEDDDDYIDLNLFHQIKEDALTCPVCFDVFKNPVNVKRCLHKFCQQCIINYNRKEKKECPGCRKSIGSKRHLRLDVKSANIISLLVTDIDELNNIV